MNKLLAVFIFITACTSAQNIDLGNEAKVVTNVNVINVRDGSVLSVQNVFIDSGKIVKISDQIGIPDGVEQINGEGKYLLPGLSEMHAHIPSPQWGRSNLNETLFLYLSNGITTIRGMLGHPVHLELREQAMNNEILSPRIFTSSPSVNGNSVKTIEEAREKVAAHKEAGYDFLKMHPGIKLEVFNEIIKTANEVGIPYAGHVSVDVGIRKALESGYASVDHIDGFLEGLVPESAGVDPSANGFFGFDFTDLADLKNVDELVALSKEKKVWIVPTQSLFERWFSDLDADSLGSTPEMQYMPKSTVESWVNGKKGLVNSDRYNPEQWVRFDQIRKKLLFALQQDGHGILLGSDAPQIFNVPGFSIHHEIKGMLNAGITPLQALQAGTVNPAKFFDMEGQFGEIIEGSSADFLLLKANPLDDMEALRNHDGVMVRGQWLSREEIDTQLAEIAKNAANQ
ncbi:MAG: amidohydrolase family protein [Cyclobacteriaceae bacterium]